MKTSSALSVVASRVTPVTRAPQAPRLQREGRAGWARRVVEIVDAEVVSAATSMTRGDALHAEVMLAFESRQAEHAHADDEAPCQTCIKRVAQYVRR